MAAKRCLLLIVYYCFYSLSSSLFFSQVEGHGRLMEPPNRSSLWRFDEFASQNPPINYDDNQLFCGGFYVQYELNGGHCGVCGDSFELPTPRDNEGGGKYGRGIIARRYTEGQVINVAVDLTKSHLGYFEFRLCPQNNPLVPVTQDCLDQHLLELGDGTGRTKFPIESWDDRFYNTTVKLPPGLTCRQCVLQWHYKTGNSYGECEDGSFDMGCGDQEVFRACSDISITAAAAGAAS